MATDRVKLQGEGNQPPPHADELWLLRKTRELGHGSITIFVNNGLPARIETGVKSEKPGDG